ncbi:glycosyltransferase [Jeotgalibacillus proteolyticus]|uniref:Glycosyltransferase n=1 Tax=Jeotgalibacillus proteolyticus TaxID=2082395 RepID=A0A2S5GB56_9BACL|nr:glycosyltransferase [Jeotgalibacillus proteolyticus]PPA70133.1 hypothetical protein C4B60_11125 [Jeotgalibacillus proteolyticus]
MKRIIMMRSPKAYLPQIDASIRYFNNKGLGFKLVDSDEADVFIPTEWDAIWSFPGIIYKNKSIPQIHEYASLSTGIFPDMKNRIKRSINTKPALRIFLNEFVQKGMNFSDGIVSLQRDMGVDDLFFRYQDTVKSYDCVYVGAITKSRGINRLLQHFKKQKEKRSLLMIGAVQDDLFLEFKDVSNITFTGSIPYEDVPKYASQAVYGINYMPNKYPYNLQTSTKLLEYLAMNLKIISTDYLWVQHFKKKHGLSFITVNEALDNLDRQLDKSEPQPLNEKLIHSLNWTNVIKEAGIEEQLSKLL